MKKKNLWAWFPVTFGAALFCCILWGSATPAIKIAYELFGIGADDTASRIMLAGSRFIIAGLMVVIFGSLIKKKFLLPHKYHCVFRAIGSYKLSEMKTQEPSLCPPIS